MPRHRCPFVQQVSRPSASVDRESREAGLDVLSDVLRAVRLTGAIYFDIHAHAPWVAESPPVETICGSVMPDFEHVICFHILMEGACWAQLADDSLPAIRLEVGDAVIFAGGDGPYMGTEQGRSKERRVWQRGCSQCHI